MTLHSTKVTHFDGKVSTQVKHSDTKVSKEGKHVAGKVSTEAKHFYDKGSKQVIHSDGKVSQNVKALDTSLITRKSMLLRQISLNNQPRAIENRSQSDQKPFKITAGESLRKEKAFAGNGYELPPSLLVQIASILVSKMIKHSFQKRFRN